MNEQPFVYGACSFRQSGTAILTPLQHNMLQRFFDFYKSWFAVCAIQGLLHNDMREKAYAGQLGAVSHPVSITPLPRAG
ncbi:hypothetical protein ACX1C1_04620 [Paenibacillus sp. strain BS8-2]